MISCSRASRERGEELAATATVVERFLLLEDPGPWGPAVLRSRRLPESVRELLGDLKRDQQVRPMLIRRPGRSSPGSRRLFAVNTRHGWVQTTLLDEPVAATGLDYSGFSGPDGIGLAAHPDPLILACTHGRHDPCCAEQGRPVAAALSRRFGELVWECSHLGGDRFAGNLVVLPRGDYFGRLDAQTAPDVLADYLAGVLDLAHHRGRSRLPRAAQAAEAAVREALGLRGIDDVEVLGITPGDQTVLVGLRAGGRTISVRVWPGQTAPARLNCNAVEPGTAPTHRVEAIWDGDTM